MDKIQVLKFGGSSLATVEAIQHCAQIVKQHQRLSKNLCVVVSAMGSQTDELLKLAFLVSKKPQQRELDMLLSTGERVSCALMAMALGDIDIKALSLTGSQCGILTNSIHQHAEIIEIKGDRIFKAFETHDVVIVAGFQGVDPVTKEITTLGRGGSDLSAVALAHRLEAKACYLYSDVPGIMTSDPRKSPHAKTVSHVSWNKAYDLACSGAKVLHYRAALLAKTKKVPLVLLNTHDPKGPKTLVGEYEEKEFFLSEKKAQLLLEVKLSNESYLANLLEFLWSQDETPSYINFGGEKTRLALSEHSLNCLKESFSSELNFNICSSNLTCFTIFFPKENTNILEKIRNFLRKDETLIFSFEQNKLSLLLKSSYAEEVRQDLHKLLL